MRETQQMRRSQFVLSYGPGSIIEGKNGPRLIPSIENGLNPALFNQSVFRDYEIVDPRLEMAIKNLTGKTARILSIPTRESIKNWKADRWIYGTYFFPTWRICYAREKHDQSNPILFRPKKGKFECPVCRESSSVSAVRFVSSCTDGHLDEVQWGAAVHYKKKDYSCNPEYYIWESRGSSLSEIEITCPLCGSNANMQEIYRMHFKCTGRFPEKDEKPDTPYPPPYFPKSERKRNCGKKMNILQRQATSLRIPEIMTFMTVPKYDDKISKILKIRDVAVALEQPIYQIEKSLDRQKEAESVFGNFNSRYVPKECRDIISEFIKKQGIEKFMDLYGGLYQERNNITDYIYEEFESLLNGERIESTNFSMGAGIKYVAENYSLIPEMKVFPVHRIRTITAQIGYKRMPVVKEEQEPKTVYHETFQEDMNWYPGFEGQGEGLFIIPSKDIRLSSRNNINHDWEILAKRHSGPWDEMWREIRGSSVFVWLHTISHSIIKALSLYCGYSSASIRERIYIDRTGSTGGILLYTTSAGEDGSMGGLIGSIADFTNILDMASENILSCSNDPLCADFRKNMDSCNGAACYSCLLISETSCEHRNMFLDRHIILGD